MKANKHKRWKQLLKQARSFIKRGFKVIPIPPREKAPRTKNWPDIRLTEEDLEDAFGPNDNIGVLLGEPSGGLIDTDLDCPEAVVTAPFFLPKTDLISGRKSNRDSHYFYIADPCPNPVKFSDLGGTVLLELRASGQVTLFPPSIHPCGEEYVLTQAKEPSRVEAAVLIQAVRRTAAATLLARHYPKKGNRHDLSLAIAGFLLRAGWSKDEARNFVTAVAFASCRDEEWKSRKRDVDTTFDRLVEGKSATGIPKLASLVGEDVASKLIEFLEIARPRSSFSYTATPRSWPERPAEEAFRGLAGEFVSLIEPHSESDPVALLVQFLVAFGNVIGRGAHFRVEADRHFTNFFAVLVGATSRSRKGSSHSHVRSLFSKVDSSWTNRCVTSGLSTGEGLIAAVRDPVLSKDGKELVDAGVEDKRLLAFEAEFAQPLKLMARERNILSTVIRQAWDNGNLRTLTKTSPVQATDAHISILGHITQHELLRQLNETELANGFGNRFLWICVKRSKLLPEGGHLRETDQTKLIEKLTRTIAWARRVRNVRRSENARKLWVRLYPRLSEGSAGLLGAVTSRAEAQVTRLSLVYALLDRSSEIKTHHLRAGLALWKYAESSARFIFGDSLGDPVADEILKALRSNPAGMTRSQISDLFARHRRSGDISRALVVLSQSGVASCRSEETQGRPDERWFAM